MRKSYLFRAVMARVEGLLGWESVGICRVYYSTQSSMTIAVTNQKNITMIPLLPVGCRVKIDGQSISSHSLVNIKTKDAQQMVCIFEGEEKYCEWAVMVLKDKA